MRDLTPKAGSGDEPRDVVSLIKGKKQKQRQGRVKQRRGVMEHAITAASMDTKHVTVGANASSPKAQAKKKKNKDQKGKGTQAGSLNDAGQTQEPEAKTGSPELGAFDTPQNAVSDDAQRRRDVRFAEPLGRATDHRMSASDRPGTENLRN